MATTGSKSSTDAERAAPAALVVLGEVIGAHGLRGELRVRWHGDGPDNLLRAAEVAMLAARGARPTPDRVDAARVRSAMADAHVGSARASGAREETEAPEWLEVRSVRPGRPGEALLSLAGVDRREAAERLAGRQIAVDVQQLAPLPEGEHYWFELVGCRVESHDGRCLGTVRELMETGAHDVLVVERENRSDLLLPAAADLLQEVDTEARRIVIELPEGFFEGDER